MQNLEQLCKVRQSALMLILSETYKTAAEDMDLGPVSQDQTPQLSGVAVGVHQLWTSFTHTRNALYSERSSL